MHHLFYRPDPGEKAEVGRKIKSCARLPLFLLDYFISIHTQEWRTPAYPTSDPSSIQSRANTLPGASQASPLLVWTPHSPPRNVPRCDAPPVLQNQAREWLEQPRSHTPGPSSGYQVRTQCPLPTFWNSSCECHNFQSAALLLAAQQQAGTSYEVDPLARG